IRLMIFTSKNSGIPHQSCKTDKKNASLRSSLPYFQFRQESIAADTLALIARIELIAKHGSTSIPKLIPYIADDSAAVGTIAINHLKSLVIMAALPQRCEVYEKGRPELGSDEVPKSLKDLVQAPELLEIFVSSSVDCLETLAGKDRNRFLARLAAFPGIYTTLTRLLRLRGYQNDLARFKKEYIQINSIQFPSQVNLSSTMACQLHCPYCISAGIEVHSGQEISLKRLHSFFAWAQNCRIERLGLSGGEPTLYKYFPMLLKMAKKSGIDLFIATNGLVSPRRLQILIQARPLCVTVHLTQEVLRTRLWDLFARNVKVMLENGLYLALRCNFLSPDDEPDIFVDAAKELKMGEVRFAFPMPNAMAINRYVSLNTFHEYKLLLSKLVSLCQKAGLNPLLAKPFPICMMSNHVRNTLVANGSLSSICPIHNQGFSNNIVMFPDTSFSPCLGLSIKSDKSLFRYHSPQHAATSFKKQIQGLLRRPLFVECESCPLFAGGQCVGACLSYRLKNNGNNKGAQWE
ncbi:MAG: radical SAM protein, partial [Candidatus Methanoperedenaceae archaeon]|nr:radical SAM protein [Candidatus Methanoperedenaceae archaeon]